jgi:ABC-type nitrate/sulfonate/bicarbonate transport system ATPase subunit
MLDIELKNVALRFPTPDGHALTVYENFNFQAERGSFTVLLGPSGCGKSTLLNLLDGLLQPSEADAVKVLGRDIREDPDATRQCAYVFQDPRLLRWKTLWANAEFGLRGLKIQPRERWSELLTTYFEMAGLSDFVRYYPHQVSGGMRQRAAIVRAWANEPRILLMDEPFSHLDEITAAQVRFDLEQLWMRDEPRRTIVFVTHDISEAVQLGERILVLTPKPSRIAHEELVTIPRPRRLDDDRVHEIEKSLRKVFAEKVGLAY